MERIGIGHKCSHTRSFGSSCSFSGKFRERDIVSSLPVSRCTIVINRVPSKVCLRAVGWNMKRKKIRHTSASLIAVSPDPSCAQVSPVDSFIEDSKCKPRPPRSKTPRKKRQSNSTAAMTDVARTSGTELRRLANALESTYSKDATICEANYETIVNDLEAQPRSPVADSGFAEATISYSCPTMLNVEERRGRLPGIAVDHSFALHLAEPMLPQNIEDGYIMRSVPPIVVKIRVGEGKCRLNLVSRIALRSRRQNKSLQVLEAGIDVVSAKQDIWSTEAEKLVKNYGVVLDLGVVDWDNLKRVLLSAAEESELAHLMIPLKEFQKVKKALSEAVGRVPLDGEWAAAAQLDVHTFRRHLMLAKAARNKLIQHNLRLVLFQAHKYHKEGLSLSLYDLCQEGVSGLIHGVDKFDPKRGHRFSTYAIYWVRNSILRAQTRSGNILRSPYNVAMHKLNIKRARLDLLVELQRAPTDEEVRNRVGLAPERFRHIVRSSARTRSMHSRSVVTGEELVESIAAKSEFNRVIVRTSRDDASIRFGVADVLDSLKPKEGLVLRQRFGLDGKGERTLGEIGQNLGLSREMVRKYEACALMKMKHPTRMDYLRTYLTPYDALGGHYHT